jgi:SAM-dependent methyltransferase
MKSFKDGRRSLDDDLVSDLMPNFIPYRCGCLNTVHAPSGVLRCIVKCDRHKAMARRPETLDEAYYTSLGVLKDGKIMADPYLRQLTEALGPIPESFDSDTEFALEIGCGVSPYADAIEAAGWTYDAVDSSYWAIQWMVAHTGTTLGCGRFEDVDEGPIFGFILAAHVFEHLDDAPGAIAKCYRLLEPGGWLWLIVPDDSDPVNPDHQWFFTEQTLRRCLESAGFSVERLVMRKYIERESFLYCAARKDNE